MRRLLLCLVFFCANAHAATFMVDRADDAVVSACSAAPNDCTLRGAITKANATTGADTINFDATVFAAPGPHVISLATALPNLTDNVTITGPNGLTVKEGDANKAFAIFTVDSDVSATLSGLTLSNGDTGIVNHGTVTTNCTISGNSTGIFNNSTLTATNCTISGNTNTGIVNRGTVTTTNCTLSNNYEGIGNSGTVTATGCTISGNSSLGIYIIGGTVTATNCTVSGNYYGIYNYHNGGTVTATSCTVSGNYYGIYNNANLSSNAVTLKNSIVAGNNINIYGGFTDGGFTDGGHNITSGTAADAGLDPAGLQDNGGPTKTIALLPGSPAIDAGNSVGIATDQRGQTRPYDNPAIANAAGGDGSDIGAFELSPTIAVNNPRSLPEGSASSPGSITFDITLSAASTQSVTVNYQTRDGINNPATAGVDYVEKHGKLTFAPGETLKRVTVKFIGDDKAETKETFFLDLTTPTNATIADSRGVGTIVNDDATPSLFQDEPSS